ncbi:endonuclease-reverse transcriptase [Plakobranchus ocellatus]|uniref:Endonuclease-reverse transcriptase n=1 Tax=Plakobranchus ocellatus TaxID=259542 RepID=A0AAV4APQ0_9GAST|nr:endonuclease-reverse transcriptase [Plakobranchus ocellatus]
MSLEIHNVCYSEKIKPSSLNHSVVNFFKDCNQTISSFLSNLLIKYFVQLSFIFFWYQCVNNRWTKRCTEWQLRSGRRDRGRPEARWMDDIRRAAGPQWQRKAQDQRKWKTSAESYILQWMDKASNNNKV